EVNSGSLNTERESGPRERPRIVRDRVVTSGQRRPMSTTLGFLILAAALEIGGDAAIRYGLLRSTSAPLVLGVVLLAAYGFAVNVNRTIDFGRLLGLYIAVFFVVS